MPSIQNKAGLGANNLYYIRIKAVIQLNHNVRSIWLPSQDRKEMKCNLIKLIIYFPKFKDETCYKIQNCKYLSVNITRI